MQLDYLDFLADDLNAMKQWAKPIGRIEVEELINLFEREGGLSSVDLEVLRKRHALSAGRKGESFRVIGDSIGLSRNKVNDIYIKATNKICRGIHLSRLSGRVAPANIPVSALGGIGVRTAHALVGMGVESIYQLTEALARKKSFTGPNFGQASLAEVIAALKAKGLMPGMSVAEINATMASFSENELSCSFESSTQVERPRG